MTAIRYLYGSLKKTAAKSHYRRYFLQTLPPGAHVFDIGCGNDSPFLFKRLRPDIRYIGLDISDYNQVHEPTKYADEYIAVPPEEFVTAIRALPDRFDAVVSSHNLEHCADPDGVLTAMARCLRPGGRLYLAFPAAESVNFPSRHGTLNFYDDPTHEHPPNYRHVMQVLQAEGLEVEFSAKRYRPLNWVLLGLVVEPVSRVRGRVMRGTWALFGFETIIWGRKPA